MEAMARRPPVQYRSTVRATEKVASPRTMRDAAKPRPDPAITKFNSPPLCHVTSGNARQSAGSDFRPCFWMPCPLSALSWKLLNPLPDRRLQSSPRDGRSSKHHMGSAPGQEPKGAATHAPSNIGGITSWICAIATPATPYRDPGPYQSPPSVEVAPAPARRPLPILA